MKYILLAAAVAFNVAAYGIFRSIAHRPHDTTWFALFGAGLALGALNLFCFTGALKQLSLSVAYPVFSAATIGLMVLGSALAFKEQITAGTLVGCALIVAGIALLARQ
jgi:multidrug transporter EmrE-like cation transporter